MTDRTETAYARSALYTIRAANVTEVDEYSSYRDGEPTCGGLWVLDLSNEDGNGLALVGSRRELIDYLDLVVAHVKFETDPLGDLDQALRRLHTLRADRVDALTPQTTAPSPPRGRGLSPPRRRHRRRSGQRQSLTRQRGPAGHRSGRAPPLARQTLQPWRRCGRASASLTLADRVRPPLSLQAKFQGFG